MNKKPKFSSRYIDSGRSCIYIIKRKILLHKIKYRMYIVEKVNICSWENIIRNKKVSKIGAYKNNGKNGGMGIAGLSGAAARTGKLYKKQ